jgi:hypothetical protein
MRFSNNLLMWVARDLSLRTGLAGAVGSIGEYVAEKTVGLKHAMIDPVLLIRWHEFCRVEDVHRIMELTEEAHARFGDRLVYLAIIPVDVPPPDSDARAALRAGTSHAYRMCRSIHIAIEGGGLRRALIRSLSAGLLLAMRQGGKVFHIHTSVPEALALAKKAVDLDVDAILAEAGRQGLLSE